jgi:hypothetical protein
LALVNDILGLADDFVFSLSGYYHCPEREILAQPLDWVLDRWDRTLRHRYQELTGQIAAVETGVSRALALAFGKKSLPELSSFDEMREQVRVRRIEREDPKRVMWWLYPKKKKDAEADDGGHGNSQHSG